MTEPAGDMPEDPCLDAFGPVADHLRTVIGDVLGEAWTVQVLRRWNGAEVFAMGGEPGETRPFIRGWIDEESLTRWPADAAAQLASAMAQKAAEMT